MLDRLSAAHTDAVSAQGYALQRALDGADFLHIPGDLRQIDVDQQVRQGLLLEVGDAPGYLGVALVVGPGERLADLVAQGAPSAPELVLEMRVFTAPGGVCGSSGIVCLGSHARNQQPGYPAIPPRPARDAPPVAISLEVAWYHSCMPQLIAPRRLRAAPLAAAGAIVLTSLLAACAGRDPSYALKNVTGLVSPLEFQLTNQDGQPVTAADYRHDIVLLYFGYTQCPDECPTTLATLANALRALGPRGSQVRVLFVSVDPRRDTTEVLKRYVSNFGPQFVGLRGEQAELTDLSKRYRIAYHYEEPDKYGNYAVDHSSAVFIFDGTGRARLLGQSDNTAQQVASDLRRLLASS